MATKEGTTAATTPFTIPSVNHCCCVMVREIIQAQQQYMPIVVVVLRPNTISSGTNHHHSRSLFLDHHPFPIKRIHLGSFSHPHFIVFNSRTHLFQIFVHFSSELVYSQVFRMLHQCVEYMHTRYAFGGLRAMQYIKKEAGHLKSNIDYYIIIKNKLQWACPGLDSGVKGCC